MSFMGPGGGVASGPASGLRFAQTRGRIQGSPITGVNYPSPFFDVAHTYLPVTVKQLFKWCRYYFLTNPLINATVFKLSEYPVTDIIIDHESTEVKNRWTEYFHEHLRWGPFRVEAGLDFFGYGNGYISIGFPFKKYLYCKACNFRDEAGKIRAQWIFTSFQFRMTCPRCGYIGDALAKDYYYKSASGVKTIRWNPEDIEVSYNDISGESTYFYTIPAVIRNDIVIGRKDVVEGIPQVFIQAMREQKGVIFSKDNFFHMRRPTLATQDRGLGTPLLLPVLKDTFYLQVMKKAQEAVLIEHIVPLRILFPQGGSGSSDPYCLTYRTLTEANYGYKASGEVVVGDIVKTASGRYAPVTAVQKRAVRPGEKVYAIEVTGMSAVPVEPSEDHPFLAVRTGGRIKSRVSNWLPGWVPVKDLQVGDYVAYPISREVRHGMYVDMAQYLENYVATDAWVYRQITSDGAAAYEYAEAREQRAFGNGELQQVAIARGWAVSTLQSAASRYRCGHRTPRLLRHIAWSKDFATILGYYLAEGCVEETRITYALHREETWICDELDGAFGRLLGLTGTRHATSDNGLSYRVNASSFAEFLKNYGGHLAWNKRLPEECVHLPEEILLELVRCLINGDGGAEQIHRDNGTGRPCRTSAITYTTTSLQLALKLRELLLYLGVIGRVHTTPVRNRRKHSIHRVKVNGQMAVDLWKKLGWCCSEEVAEIKKDTTRSFILGGYAYFRVQKKEELAGVDFVYGFQVDGDKSFCVPSCAQHNTTINLIDWRDQVAAEIARWRYDCITPETLVETAEGLREAGEVLEGDSLKNHLGAYSKVEKVWRRPLREGERAYQLVVRGMRGDIPTVSEGHSFLIRRKQNNGNGHQIAETSSFVRAKDIHAGDYVGYPVPVFKPHGITELDLADFVTSASTERWVYLDHHSPETPEAFEYLSEHGAPVDRQVLLEKKGWSVNQYKAAQSAVREGRVLCRLPRRIPLDEELCWVLGLYLAEGSASSKQVLFALHANETPFVVRLDRFFKERFDANGFTAECGANGIQRYYSSTIAAQFFHEMCGGISTTKRIHSLLKCAGDKRLAALMRGYFDGDGCYHDDDSSGCVDVSSASRQLAADCLEILLSSGVLASLTSLPPAPYSICGKTGMSHGSWKIAAHGVAARRLRIWLGLAASDAADAGSRIGLFADGYLWRRIEEVREVEALEVIGFQVDKSVFVRLEDDTEVHGTFCLRVGCTGNSNYIPILPLPIGNQTIGGDGRALLLTQEIATWSDQILNGMGVPVEFIKGGLSYAGTNVSMRMMENMFLGYISRQKALAKFVMKQVASFLGWPEAGIRFKPFKMADDLQRKAYLFQLNAAGKVSDTTLLADSDLDQNDENQIMIRETDKRIEATKKQQLAMATIQGEAQQIMLKFQTKAQQDAQKAMAAPVAPGEPGGADVQGQGGGPGGAGGAGAMQAMPSALQSGAAGNAAGPMSGTASAQAAAPAPGAGASPQDFLSSISSQLTGAQRMKDEQQSNIDLPTYAMGQARFIATMPKPQQEMALKNLQLQSPELADLVKQMMAELMPVEQGDGGSAGVDTRPLPQQRPPRRAGGMV